MRKVLISVLSVLLIAFLVGCQESDSDDSSGDSAEQQQEALEEAQREITQARQAAEQAREEAERAREEAEGGPQEQGDDPDEGGAEDSSDSASSSEESAELSPVETLDLQYQFLNSGQYEKAYNLFAEQSQRLISLEQYSSAYAPTYEVSDYTVYSEQIQGDTATLEAELFVSGTQRGSHSYSVTQEFVREDGEWRVIMRDAQAETIANKTSGQDGSEEADSDVTQAGSCSVGEACDLGISTITVTNAQPTNVVSGVGETYEGNFVVVEFDYTYGGDSPSEVDEPPFQLVDGSGATYSLDFDATVSYEIENDRSLIYETVQPGVSSPGAVVFEVAPGASGFTLQVSDLIQPQSGEAAEIPLGF